MRGYVSDSSGFDGERAMSLQNSTMLEAVFPTHRMTSLYTNQLRIAIDVIQAMKTAINNPLNLIIPHRENIFKGAR
jgi:hypothetical protein